MFGNIVNDPFIVYQEAAKVMSGDDMAIRGSRRMIVVKVDPSSSSQRKKPIGGGVTTRSARLMLEDLEAICGSSNAVLIDSLEKCWVTRGSHWFRTRGLRVVDVPLR